MRLNVAALLTTLALTAQTAIDVTKLGPQIGATITDFSLKDARGQSHSIRSAAGPKGTMLVFFRSADW